jgi:putative transposase
LILSTHWVLVVMDQFTRRIVGFGVHAGVLDGPALCRMLSRAIAGAWTLPRHLSSDHDPLFEFHRWKANLRILDVTEIKTVPEVPLSHPFIERLVGTIRRELLDQIPFWSAGDLERKLLHFKDYYNRDRVHASLGGVTPACKAADVHRRIVSLSKFRWQSHCRGLYQLPVAA